MLDEMLDWFARPITGKTLQQRQLKRFIFETKLAAEYLFEVVISTLLRLAFITLIIPAMFE